MAIVVEANATLNTNNVGSTNSHSHTFPTGKTDTILVVLWVAFSSAGTANSGQSSCTYNGVALTQIAGAFQNLSFSGGRSTGIWYLVNPPTGANTLLATMSGSCDNSTIYANNLSGVDQVSPVDASNALDHTASGIDPETITVTSVADNVFAYSVHSNAQNGNCAPSGGQTSLGSAFSGFINASYTGPITPPGLITHGYTNGAAEKYLASMASFKPTAAASISRMATLGCG